MVAMRKAYDRERVSFVVVGDSMTKQSHKLECDINTIMRKYQKTGLVSHVSVYQGQYGEMPDVEDYQDALAALDQAQAAFASLPSDLRTRFENDPAKFLEFVQKADRKALQEAGLLPAEPRVVEPPATVVAPKT